MKNKIVKLFFIIISIGCFFNCKTESKNNDFSWDKEEEVKTEKVKETSKDKSQTDTAFEFEKENEPEPEETSYTELTGDPTFGIQVIDGSVLGKQSHVYDTDRQLLFLVATKLCKDFDYKNVFGEYRNGNLKNGKERVKIEHCCSALVISPYIEPMEYYLSLYHENKDVYAYKDNVFKLREIRENLEQEKRSAFEKLLTDVDSENLVSYKMVTSSIEGYDFETKQLKIKYYVSDNQQIGQSGIKAKLAAFPKRNYRYSSTHTYLLNMAESEAKALFEYYASLNEYSKNPPFKLVTKTTYKMGIPKLQKRPYNFESKIKTIAFYKLANGFPVAENKIAELQINYE